MNTITRKWCKDNNIDFDLLIDDLSEINYEEHRKYSSFYRTSIIEINEEYFPELPSYLYGFWETDSYIWDDSNGAETYYINSLYRVEPKEKTIVKKYWEKV